MEVQLKSEITCPNCGHKKVEEMPTESLVNSFYECENCKTVLTTKRRRLLCLLQSYGTVACPPIQEKESCC